jgi:predicted RNA-binding Zn-ribbon protein involved in translation (DUF1610 family)
MSEEQKSGLSKVCIICKKEIFYTRRSKPKVCPECGDKYWDKPADERNLFLLQDKYIEGGYQLKDVGIMYPLLLKYSENIIKNKLKGKKILSEDDFYDKSNELALIMIERYTKNPKDVVKSSFGGLMMWVANGVLFGSRKDDQVDSLNRIYGSDGKELEDSLAYTDTGMTLLSKTDPQEAHNLGLLRKFEDEIEYILMDVYWKNFKVKSSNNLWFLVGMDHVLNNRKNILNGMFFMTPYSTKEYIKEAEKRIWEHLKEKLLV